MERQARPSDDEAATAQTIAAMRALVDADALAPAVQRAAWRAAAGATTARKRAEDVFWWIKQHVRFVEDAELARPLSGTPDEDEVLVRPIDLLAMPCPAGDCDDFSMLCAAMLRVLGVPSEFVTVAANRKTPEMYSHVYVRAATEDGWLALDCSHGPRPGWECARAGKIRTWPVMTKSNLHGLGDIDWGSIVETAVKGTTNILQSRYGVPPTGTYVQTGANGQSVVYRQQPGSAPLDFPATGGVGGLSLTTLLLIAGVLVAVVMVAKSK